MANKHTLCQIFCSNGFTEESSPSSPSGYSRVREGAALLREFAVARRPLPFHFGKQGSPSLRPHSDDVNRPQALCKFVPKTIF